MTTPRTLLCLAIGVLSGVAGCLIAREVLA